jgi:hypothetical protein
MHTRHRMIYKKRDGRVTQSQAHPLYSLDYCAEANWKPVILSLEIKALLNYTVIYRTFALAARSA